MIIYVDLVILFTLLINYLFIKSINILFNSKTSLIRMIVSSIISVIALLFFILPFPILWYLRHLYGIVIGLAAFPDKNKSKRISKILLFYIMNYLLIGTLEVFKIKSYLWLIIISLIIIIIIYIEYFLKIKVVKENNYISNDYYINEKPLKTLIDSGNKCYYQGTIVSFLDEKFQDENYIMIGEMLTKSILGEILINIYLGPPIKYHNKEIITYFAFMKLDDYDLIIGIGEEND